MISIIIPTLNESASIGPCLQSLRMQAPPFEVLIADGGSTDGTVEIARQAGPPVRVLQIDPTIRGRARAYNAAAAEAAGETLLFLHVDVMLPAGGLEMIRHALGDPAIAGGGFVHAYPGRERLLRLNAAIMVWVTRQFKHISGDQAAFVRKRIFDQMGGFAPWRLMEDYEFIDRLKRYGKLAVLQPGVVSSPRRALANGVLRTQGLILLLWSMYKVGVSPDRIATYYARWSRDGHEVVASKGTRG